MAESKLPTGRSPATGVQPQQANRYRLAPTDGFVGPIQVGQPMATGKILGVGATVAPGGSFTVAHGLGRIPVYPRIVANSGFPGDCYIKTASSTTATIVVENSCFPGTLFYLT